jgi:hypothetical protein
MDSRRIAPPVTLRDRLLRNPMHGEGYIRLRDGHREVVEPTWMKGRGTARCSTCGTHWPCELGQALAVIEYLLTVERWLLAVYG